jgi:integrase
MSRTARVPSYRRHKGRNLAMVVIGGKARYLGRWNSPESKVEYARLIREWSVSVDAPTVQKSSDLTVSEMLVAYMRHAKRHYRDPDGKATTELAGMVDAIKPLRKLYGVTLATDFGPLALRAVREDMVQSGLARKTVNARVGRLRRVFRWAASVELIPATIIHALGTVPALQCGRTEAPEAPPIGPVPLAVVEKTIPFLSRTVAAMVRFQLAAACRAGEVTSMRRDEIVQTPDGWVYIPTRHKGSWRGKGRTIPLGPKALAVLQPFLVGDPTGYVFTPRQAREDRRIGGAAKRKTKVQPSQVARAKAAKHDQPVGERYGPCSYRTAVNRACLRAGVKPWSPLQLRHTAATLIRSQFGLEAAQSVLGHAKADVTQIYAERDLSKARVVADAIG